MSAPDEIARCSLSQPALRVIAAITTETTVEIARRHAATGGVVAALGRAATTGVLLATLTKDEERVTMQLLADGPLGGITVDAASNGNVRAFLKDPSTLIPALPGARVALGPFMGRGTVAVTRDLGLKETFSGQTELVDGEIDTDLEHYLIKSEQIDSVLACETLLDASLGVRISGGVLLQALPATEATPLLTLVRERMRGGLLASLLGHNGIVPTAAKLASAVLGDLEPALRVLDVRPVKFHCPCSRERAENALKLLGTEELAEMFAKEGGGTVTCEFCREVYRFDAPPA